MDDAPRPTRRPECPADAAFLAALHREVHPLPGLDPALAEALLRQQVTAQRTGYRAAHPRARFDIVEIDGEPVGRIVVDEGAEGWRVVDVALRAHWRGRGIGTRLLREVMAGGRPVRLRVARGNEGARRLYERLGFASEDEDAVDVGLVWWKHPPGKTYSAA